MHRALAMLLAALALLAPIGVATPALASPTLASSARIPDRLGLGQNRIYGNFHSGTAEAEGHSLFLQRDPAGYTDSVNLYAAFANDPVNRRDPTGEESEVDGQRCTWGLVDLKGSGPKVLCAELYLGKARAWAGSKLARLVPDKAKALAVDVVETQRDQLGYALVDSARAFRKSDSDHYISEKYIKEKGTEAVERGIATAVAVAGTTLVISRAVDGAGSALSEARKLRAEKNRVGGVYALRDPDTGQIMRTGRTKNLPSRRNDHARDPELAHLDFEEIYQTNDYAEQRGLEQLVHDKYSPPLNKIRPISPINPKRKKYLDAAEEYLRRLLRQDPE